MYHFLQRFFTFLHPSLFHPNLYRQAIACSIFYCSTGLPCVVYQIDKYPIMVDEPTRCLSGFCVYSVWSAVIILVDAQIVQRRDTIVQRGRELQNSLHIPNCLRVFAEADPGMLKEDLRAAAHFLVLACAMVVFGVLVAFLKWTVRDSSVLGAAVIGPLCIVLLVWLGLILGRRKISKGNFQDDREDPEKGTPNNGWNPGLKRALRGFRATAVMVL